MTRYRKRPIEIEAVQLRWATWSQVCEVIGMALRRDNHAGARMISASEAADTCGEDGPDYIALDLLTAHGDLATFRHGDWIIPDAKPGTFYPCTPDVFEQTYEPVALAVRQASEVPDRHAIAIRTAVPMAQAADRGALDIVYRLWDSLDEVGKVDVIAALAQLPAWMVDLMGGDATERLAEAARLLTEEDSRP